MQARPVSLQVPVKIMRVRLKGRTTPLTQPKRSSTWPSPKYKRTELVNVSFMSVTRPHFNLMLGNQHSHQSTHPGNCALALMTLSGSLPRELYIGSRHPAVPRSHALFRSTPCVVTSVRGPRAESVCQVEGAPSSTSYVRRNERDVVVRGWGVVRLGVKSPNSDCDCSRKLV